MSGSVLALADSLVSFMYHWKDLLPFAQRNDESFTSKDEAIFNCYGVSVAMVWA